MEKIDIYSPVDNSYIGQVEAMSKEKIDEKVKNLLEVFEEYKKIDILKRVNILKKVSKKIEESTEYLAKIMAMEIAKSYKDCVIEIKRSVEMINYTLEEALRLDPKVYSGASMGVNKTCLSINEPIGLVLCIAPYNYPINLSLSKIIPALVMGNVVLYKPPTQGSYTCSILAKIINDNMEYKALELCTGKGSVIGDHINTLKNVKLVNFTGSTGVGKSISKLAVMKTLIMELGGKDAAIVLEDANLEKAAREIVSGAYNYSGQRCTAIKRVLVIDSVADKLSSLILEKVKKLKVGHPLDNADITALIDKKSADYVQMLIEDAIDKKAKLLIGNKREGNIIYPTLLDNVTLDMKVAFEEPFGPVLPIIRVKDMEEAIKIANMSDYGLQSSVFTENMEKAFYISKKLEVGTVHINSKTSRGPDNFPFLGIKDSGMGVQGIRDSLYSMCKLKNIILNINI